MRTRVHVIQGRLAESEPHRTSAIEAAYQHFRPDKQGSLVSPKTLRPLRVDDQAVRALARRRASAGRSLRAARRGPGAGVTQRSTAVASGELPDDQRSHVQQGSRRR